MNKFIFFVLLLSPVFGRTQAAITGSWRINQLVGLSEESEYSLFASSEPHIYGNRLELKPDGTFLSAYSAKCGNDCFTSNTGKYERVGENHIRFLLERVLVDGDCESVNIAPNKDLGLFYICRDSSKIRLIKSDGNRAHDSLRAMYSNRIDDFDLETSKIYNLYFMPWKKTDASGLSEIVKDCLATQQEINFENVKILFSKKIRTMFEVILLEENGRYYYVVYETWRQNVALYDPAKLPK